MSRQQRIVRVTARDSRATACHGHTGSRGHGGAPPMGRLTHHNTPGPVGRPHRNSVGHAIIASVVRGVFPCGSASGQPSSAGTLCLFLVASWNL
eukprot:1897615-Prymnesium_polylepis.1